MFSMLADKGLIVPIYLMQKSEVSEEAHVLHWLAISVWLSVSIPVTYISIVAFITFLNLIVSHSLI